MRTTSLAVLSLVVLSGCDYDWDHFRVLSPMLWLPFDAVSDPSTVVDHFEAEERDDGACEDVPGFHNLCRNATIERAVTLSAGESAYELSARVYGVEAVGELPQMALLVDAAVIRMQPIAATAESPVVVQSEQLLPGGPHVFAIEFLNDYDMPPANRDLRVDWLEVRAVGEGRRITAGVSGARTGVVHGATPTRGVWAGALHFDGVDDDVVFTSATPLALGVVYAVACWVRPTSTLGAGTVIGVHANPELVIRIVDGGGLQAVAFGASTTASADFEIRAGPGTLVAGQWQHVALSVSRTDLAIYVDGSLVATRTIARTLAAADGGVVYVGRSGWDSIPGFFAGDIDDLQIYDEALTPDQVLSVMSRPTEGG